MARVLILVENLPSPFDRRVRQEATTLAANGYEVAIICPTGPGCEAHDETLEGIRVLRYDLPLEASGALGYLREYSAALWHTFRLAWREHRHRRAGFDIVHACNPPDLLFLIAGFFKWYAGARFVFDHHDITPELYEAKFKRRDFLYRLMVRVERWTFRSPLGARRSGGGGWRRLRTQFALTHPASARSFGLDSKKGYQPTGSEDRHVPSLEIGARAAPKPEQSRLNGGPAPFLRDFIDRFV